MDDSLVDVLRDDAAADIRQWALALWENRQPDLITFRERFSVGLLLAILYGMAQGQDAEKGDSVLYDGQEPLSRYARQPRVPAITGAFKWMTGKSAPVFRELIDNLARKNPTLLVRSPKELDPVARQTAWYVSGVLQGKILEEIKTKLINARVNGTSQSQFIQSVHSVQNQGDSVLSAARIETVFRTNVASAAAAGRIRQMEDPDVADLFWGYRYYAHQDDRARPLHRLMNGFIAKKDDPVWRVITTPCGYNCRCALRGVRKHQAIAAGLIDKDGRYLVDRIYANEWQARIIDAAMANRKLDYEGQEILFPDEGFRGNALAGILPS